MGRRTLPSLLCQKPKTTPSDSRLEKVRRKFLGRERTKKGEERMSREGSTVEIPGRGGGRGQEIVNPVREGQQ